MSDTCVLDSSRRPLAQRLARCFSVSVFTTLLSLCVLSALAFGLGVRAWLANVIATAAGTVPSYVLNRRWVWGRRDASDPWREVMPFWVMSFAGLLLSTVAVDAADALARDLAVGAPLHLAALLAANVGAFGALWVAQFIVLDRVLFGRPVGQSRGSTWSPGSVRPVQRLCERPGCGDPASVSYGFDAGSRMLWLDALGPDGPASGVLCRRHADAMRLPKGWWLQDRRAGQALFSADAPTTTGGRQSAYRVRRPRIRTGPSAEPLPIEGGDARSATDGVVAPGWSPDFDPSDDLGGVLDAKTPLLARAFGRPAARPAE